MVKVLIFVDRLLWGGIQSLIIDWINNINHKNFVVELLTLDDGVKYNLEEKLINKGVIIHKLDGVWLRNGVDFINYCKQLNSFFNNNHDYHVVHMNSGPKNFFVLYYAKKYGIPIRIAHSHNTGYQTHNIVKKLLGDFLKPFLKAVSTHYLACSENAAIWMFGKKFVNKGKVIILRNGIDSSQFYYDINKRNKLRCSLGISDEFVIGCVGRLEKQKNHKFLIDVFAEVKKERNRAKLLIIGEGKLEVVLRERVKYWGLENDVYFLGFCENRNEWLSAMDVFVLTSLYEGLGIVLIEAQISGLPCFASSDVIPREAKITDRFCFVSLKESPKIWASKICKTSLENRKTVPVNEYEIKNVVNQLEEIYSIKFCNNEQNHK